MDESDRRGEAFVAEFREEPVELSGREHALERQRRRRQGREVESGVVEPLPHDEGSSGEVVVIAGWVVGVEAEEHIAHGRHGLGGDPAEHSGVDGHGFHVDDLESLFCGDPRYECVLVDAGGFSTEVGLRLRGQRRRDSVEVGGVVLGEEADAHGIVARSRK